MIELEVHNFQSIRKAMMSVDGFAAIVGRSNIGKSAIVRAAQYALTGATGTHFVRHGPDCDRRLRNTKTCKCSSRVVIRTQAMELIWEKGDTKNQYTITRDGKTSEHKGLERGTPDFLEKDFRAIKLGDRKEMIQIPEQFEPIFLLNQTGPTVAEIMSDVARLDGINAAMGVVIKDRKDLLSKRKVREGDIKTLGERLGRYAGLDDVPVQGVVDLLKVVKDKQVKWHLLDQFISTATVLKEALQGLLTVSKIEVPDQSSVEERAGRLSQVESFLAELSEKAPIVKRLSGVDRLEVPEDDTLWESAEALSKAEAFSSRLESIKAALRAYGDVGSVEVPDLQTQLLERLNQVSNFLGRLTQASESLDIVGEELRQIEASEAEVLAELEALGICPTCTQPLSESHRLHLEAS